LAALGAAGPRFAEIELHSAEGRAAASGVAACLAQPRLARCLRRLVLRGCAGVGDELLAATQRPPLAALELLDLSFSGRACMPTGSNADGTVALARAPLAAGDGSAISDIGLLTVLGLGLVRDGAADAPAAPLPRACGAWASLTALRVAGCRFLTDAGVSAALRGCPRLVELDASRCELLEGSFLEALAEAPVAARLERLALAHAGSAASVAEAFRAHAARFLAPELSLPRLAVLDVSWCPWLGDDELALLARALRAAHGLRALSLHARIGRGAPAPGRGAAARAARAPRRGPAAGLRRRGPRRAPRGPCAVGVRRPSTSGGRRGRRCGGRSRAPGAPLS
jgi:hypothetical protein